jgi:hypothetical protein
LVKLANNLLDKKGFLKNGGVGSVLPKEEREY